MESSLLLMNFYFPQHPTPLLFEVLVNSFQGRGFGLVYQLIYFVPLLPYFLADIHLNYGLITIRSRSSSKTFIWARRHSCILLQVLRIFS